MIMVQLRGGLGNQLFQYAAARALAEKHSNEVKLDITDFETYDLRSFDLAKLPISLSIATQGEIAFLKATTPFQRIKARLTPYHFKRFYKEPHFHFDTSFFRLPNAVYLQGYFQSEKYFSPIRERIIREFDPTSLAPEPVKQKAAALRNEISVALHIRRGDYNNPNTLSVHGILPDAYYQQAIALVKLKHPGAKFYIFSDDPSAASSYLNAQEAEVISGTVTKNHFEDLYLMSQCRHNIIANSSFSWWGAWLNPNKEKLVIAPKNWFNKGPKDTQDLLPESWVKL